MSTAIAISRPAAPRTATLPTVAALAIRPEDGIPAMSLDALVRTAAEGSRGTARARGIAITWTCPERLVAGFDHGDLLDRLARLLSRVARNALEGTTVDCIVRLGSHGLVAYIRHARPVAQSAGCPSGIDWIGELWTLPGEAATSAIH
jgi:hypothetical protein